MTDGLAGAGAACWPSTAWGAGAACALVVAAGLGGGGAAPPDGTTVVGDGLPGGGAAPVDGAIAAAERAEKIADRLFFKYFIKTATCLIQ